MAEKVMAYCIKCKTKKEMKDPKIVTFPNKRKGYKGKCVTCGTVMVMAIKKKEGKK